MAFLTRNPMSEVLELSDADFAMQMRGLIHEAERALTDRSPGVRTAGDEIELEPAPSAAPLAVETPATPPAPAPARPAASSPDMLRPLVQGMQAIGRASGE